MGLWQDHDGLSGDVAGIVGGKEGHGGAHVVGVAEIWQRSLRGEYGADIFGKIVGGSLGENKAGCDGVAADAAAAVLGGSVFGKGYYSGF